MSFTEYHCFRFLDVYRIRRPADNAVGSPRPFSALALRLSGESVFTVAGDTPEGDASKGDTLHAGAGSLIYIPAGVAFSRESTEEELIVIHLQIMEEEERQIEVWYPHNSPSVTVCFQQIWQEWEAREPGYLHRCTALLHTLLAQLEEHCEYPAATYRQQLISRGVLYLDANYDDPEISIARIAERCNVSEAYFRRLYKEAYGISPHQAIVEKRLQKACRLLQTGYFSIEETAAQSGFENCKYFSTLFHKKMSMSPREYKKQFCAVIPPFAS